MVIVVTNRAGGVGKTSLSILASMYIGGDLGHKVLLVDGDVSQADALRWSTGKEDFDPGVVYETSHGFDVVWITGLDDLKGLGHKEWKFVIVDGRPSDFVCSYFARHADIVIIPFFKRGRDVDKTRQFVRFLERQGIKVNLKLFYNKYCKEIGRRDCLSAPEWFKSYVAQKMVLGVGDIL